MTSKKKVLVCRSCGSAPELMKTDDGDDVVHCPKCRASGNHDEVIEAAKVFLAQSFSYGAIEELQQRLQTSERRSKHVTYKPGKLPNLAPPDSIFR